jgi:four helix bundle protein
MTENFFDHDRLDVYRLSIEYVADAFDISRSLEGLHRHARDQWLRAAQSIPLNIAEGNGKRSLKDRARFLDIARGSALECAAIDDILLSFQAIDSEPNRSRRKLSSTSTRRKRTRKNIGPNVLLATSIFSLDPWNPFLASLEIREWKETPSHARASFLGGIGFIGPNAPFARDDGQARANGACEPKDFQR